MPRYKPPLKDSDRNVTDPEKARKRTFDRAVNLLTYRQRSVSELRHRLLEKPWTNHEIVDSVIEKLKEYNYLNDDEYAFNLASSTLRAKAVGKRRLKEVLMRKKLDGRVIESALERAFEEVPESVLIERAVEKRLRVKGNPETRNEQKNFFAYLMRQGFEYDLIREQMERLR